MLDIGWQELLVIGVIALLVVGPKELPGLLRTVGQWAGRARSVARDFQRSMEDAAREADLDELKNFQNIKRDVEKMGRIDHAEQARRAQPQKKSTPAAAPETTESATVASETPRTDGAATGAQSSAEPAPKAAGASTEG
jgi:sec-independent protein translocase protein TatB